MTQILYFLFWFFIFLYFFKIILRLIAPFLLKFFANRMKKKFEQQFQNFNSKDNNYKQQEDFISNEKLSKKSKTDDLGEYVDFEEIED